MTPRWIVAQGPGVQYFGGVGEIANGRAKVDRQRSRRAEKKKNDNPRIDNLAIGTIRFAEKPTPVTTAQNS